MVSPAAMSSLLLCCGWLQFGCFIGPRERNALGCCLGPGYLWMPHPGCLLWAGCLCHWGFWFRVSHTHGYLLELLGIHGVHPDTPHRCWPNPIESPGAASGCYASRLRNCPLAWEDLGHLGSLLGTPLSELGAVSDGSDGSDGSSEKRMGKLGEPPVCSVYSYPWVAESAVRSCLVCS